jgi:hypothetical protein
MVPGRTARDRRRRYDRSVRKLVQLVLVAFGVRALLRWRKRREAEAQAELTTPSTAEPADELRQRLAESREDDAPAVPETSVEDRRADVHEQGRAALDEMKSPDEA